MADEGETPDEDEPLYTPRRRVGQAIKEKSELRTLVQREVLVHTTALRARLAALVRVDNPSWTSEEVQSEVDARQPLVEEYDPVVELARIGADHSQKVEIRRQANADAAQYLRSKLKSIEITEDPEKLANEQQQSQIGEKLAAMFERMYTEGSDAVPATTLGKKPE